MKNTKLAFNKVEWKSSNAKQTRNGKIQKQSIMQLKPVEMTIQGEVQLMTTDDQNKTGDKQDEDKDSTARYKKTGRLD